MNHYRKLLLLFLLLFPVIISFSQTDHEFWFVAPAVTYQTVAPSPNIYDHLNQPVALYFTTSAGPATVKIEQPANPSFTPIYRTVTNFTAAQVVLTSLINSIENTPANTILNRGLRITSDKPVTAFYEIQSPKNSATYTLSGRNALGTEFIIPSQFHYVNYPYTDPPAKNVFDIVATEDSTLITIIPRAALMGHAANDTFAVMLNRGQTWSGRALSNDSTAHLGGSVVLSDKPIAVTITDDAVFIPNTCSEAYDIAGDQLIPRHQAGTDYIMNNQTNWQMSVIPKLFVFAFEDSTTVSYTDNNKTFFDTIDRGEYAEFAVVSNTAGQQGSVIHSGKPVIVYHFFAPNPYDCPQPVASLVPPMSCGGSKRVSFTLTPPGVSGGGADWIWYIVTHDGNQGNFHCTPSWITIQSNSFSPVPGTNGEYVEATMGFYNFGTYTNVVIWNTEGNFQLSALTDDEGYPPPNIPFAKFSYFTDFSALYLGTDKKICQGDTVILDAGYGKDSYLWNTGDTTQIIKVLNPGTYWVVASQDTCVMSDTIQVSYYYNQPLNLGPDRLLCPGDSILLNAGPGRSWYLWSTGATTQTIWVKNPDIYWVKVQDIHCIVNDTINIGYMTSFSLGPDRSTCQGDSVLLDAGPGMSDYLWSTGAVTQTLWVKNPGNYWVVVHSGFCMISDTVNVAFVAPPGVSLGPDTTICTGQNFTFDAGYCTGCTYQWANLSTGLMNVGIAQTYTASQPGIYMATVTGADGCKGRDTVNLAISPPLLVSISIGSSAGTVCAGTGVSFTAVPVNPGPSPLYEWMVNGFSAGGNSPVFSYIPNDGDLVFCRMTSSITSCISNNQVVSNSLLMTVYPILPVSISIAASANPTCMGHPVTLTATGANIGLLPAYLWKVNGGDAGTNSPVYTYNPAEGDMITCLLTSSESCTTGNPAISNTISMTVNANLPGDVSIAASANPFCESSTVTYTALPANGQLSPSFQWMVNGTPAGINAPIYTYLPHNGDSIRCVMTSALNCVTPNPASSNKIIMVASIKPTVTFTQCNDAITTLNAQPFKLKGGTPSGGVYSGPGVNASTGIFTPSMAGTGIKTIQYTYTNVVNCSDSKTTTITVHPAPTFTCGNILTDIRDGKHYNTFVLPDGKCWMQTNLDFGWSLSEIVPQTDNCVAERYQSSYANDNSSLYQWDEMMNYEITAGTQGLCPPGWHVPTSVEWDDLISVFTGSGQAAGPMKDTLLVNGFRSLQHGFLYQNNTWAFMSGIYAGSMYWTSTDSGNNRAIARGINEYNHSVSSYPSLHGNAFSVRCTKD